MNNKIKALEEVITLVTDAAVDIEDLREIMEVLYNKADKLDRKITKIEDEM